MSTGSEPNGRDAFAAVLGYDDQVRVVVAGATSILMVSGRVAAWDDNGLALTHARVEGAPVGALFVGWARVCLVSEHQGGMD